MRDQPQVDRRSQGTPSRPLEFGLYTFGDLTPRLDTGRPVPARQRLEEVVAAARLADDAGLEVFGVGEHHRLDFAVASPAMVLAAIASVTRTLRLTSAVSVLGTLDPVRLFQDFATLDLLSGGRAEIVAGRGVFTESFPLFGDDLRDYDDLFAEKLDLLLALGRSERITWRGRFRPALADVEVAPRPVRPGGIPVWVGVGGTPESAVRTGRLGLPLALANLGGPFEGTAALAQLYRQAGARAGHDGAALRVGLNAHAHLARTSQGARDRFFPVRGQYFRHCTPSHMRGGDALPRAMFDHMASPAGGLLVGSPQEVVDKLGHARRLIGFDRVVLQIDIGGQPYAHVAEMIELLATQVVPAFR